MSVKSKLQRWSVLKCVNDLAWDGAQTDISVSEDVVSRRNMDSCRSISSLFSDPCSRCGSHTPPALSFLNIPFALLSRGPAIYRLGTEEYMYVLRIFTCGAEQRGHTWRLRKIQSHSGSEQRTSCVTHIECHRSARQGPIFI